MSQFTFKLEKTLSRARAGTITTSHGQIKTPIFMPVGTRASVKALDAQDLETLGAQIILSNTYHLYLRPGEKVIAEQGGLHEFMNWPHPILTDSGGFQVFSLNQVNATNDNSSLVKVDDQGVEFRSHLDGSTHFFTPQKAIEIQRQLGADIIMTFDDCTPHEASKKQARLSVERTHDWAKQAHDYWEQHQRLSAQGHYQALFGIVQGGFHPELRKTSAKQIVALDFNGVAVGGETIGYNMPATRQVMDWIEPLLPEEKPRYAMGLGRDPEDLIAAVMMGFDMFDCVGPTRLARNGALYHGHLEMKKNGFEFMSEFKHGRLNIGRQEFAQDNQPIMTECQCQTCQAGYTRAYLHHLAKNKELSFYRLASIHNLHFMFHLTEQMREGILKS